MSDSLRNWLSLELNRRNLSIRELGRLADVSYSLISRVITGDVPPSADFCLKIAHALGESPEFLLRLAGLLPPPADMPDDPTIAEVLELLRRLSPEDRQEVLRYTEYRYRQGK